jgi:hypothetical protein
MELKQWNGTPPKSCDVCGRTLKQQFVDGKTKMGPWAIMDPVCHKEYGVGLGPGRGQRYDLQTLKQIQ